MSEVIALDSEIPIEEILAATPFTRKYIVKCLSECAEQGFVRLNTVFRHKKCIVLQIASPFYREVYMSMEFYIVGCKRMVYYNWRATYGSPHTWDEFCGRFPEYLAALTAARKKLTAPFIAAVTEALPQPIAEEMAEEIYVAF